MERSSRYFRVRPPFPRNPLRYNIAATHRCPPRLATPRAIRRRHFSPPLPRRAAAPLCPPRRSCTARGCRALRRRSAARRAAASNAVRCCAAAAARPTAARRRAARQSTAGSAGGLAASARSRPALAAARDARASRAGCAPRPHLQQRACRDAARMQRPIVPATWAIQPVAIQLVALGQPGERQLVQTGCEWCRARTGAPWSPGRLIRWARTQNSDAGCRHK